MNDCIITPYAPAGTMGYGQIEIEGKTYQHHRLVYCTHHKLPITAISGIVIRHTCDNPRCVNPAHLVQGTHKDNTDDRDARKRTAVGSKAGRAKVTEEQVREIRTIGRLHTNQVLGKMYGLNPSCISDILTRKTWKHI